MATNTCGEWNCTAEEYHADIELQSRSMAWMYRNEQGKYYGQFVSKTVERDPPTRQMITGSLSHLFILEPQRLKSDVVIIPESVLAKNGAKSTNAYRDFSAEHVGKLLVKRDEFDLAQSIVDVVRTDSQVKRFKLLEGGQAERTIVWQDSETGLMCKARFDYYTPGVWSRNVIVDIKTTDDVSPQAFSTKSANLGYYFQDEFYSIGDEALSGVRPIFVFIAVSKMPPIEVACHVGTPTFKEIGARHVRDTLNTLAKSIQYDDWLPQHRKQINEISPPLWLENSDRWRLDNEHGDASTESTAAIASR